MSTLGDRPPDDPFVSTAEFHEHVTREQRRSWGTPLIILEGTGAEKWVRYNSTPLKQNRSDLSPPVSRLSPEWVKESCCIGQVAGRRDTGGPNTVQQGIPGRPGGDDGWKQWASAGADDSLGENGRRQH